MRSCTPAGSAWESPQELRRGLMALARADAVTPEHRVLIGRVIARLGEPASPAPQPTLTPEMSQFLTDVVTAAGLLAHGKRDKVLADRIGAAAFRIRTENASPSVGGPIVTDAAVQSLGMALAKQHAVYLTTDSVRKLLTEALAAPEGKQP